MKQNLLTKVLLLFALIVGSSSVCGQDNPEVTLDFTTNSWGFPTSGTNQVTDKNYSNGTYTITVTATTSVKFDSSYLLLGKSGSTLTLPAFGFDVEKIVVVGNSGASTKVTQNIYVGTTAVSTSTTGATGTYTYQINENYQSSGTNYTLKVTNANNTQITYIKIYKKPNTQAYTVHFSDGKSNDITESAANAGVTLPTREDITGYTFVGWSESEVSEETETTPTILNSPYYPSSNKTLYPVYMRSFEVGAAVSTKAQTLEYDTWTYYGDTYDNKTYRIFCKDSYIESETFDLSKLEKVIVYGGGSYGTLPSGHSKQFHITDGTTTWATKTTEGTSQTNAVTVTSNVALSGMGKLQIVSDCGTKGSSLSATSGLRFSKVEIYLMLVPKTVYYISNPVASVFPIISSAGYATFSNGEALDFSTNEDLMIYTATDNGTSVSLNEVSSKKVPANTPVILKCDEGCYTGVVIASADALDDNDLHISNGTDAVGDDIYVLANKSHGVGFYPWTSSNSLSAGKIYLKSVSNAPFLGFDGEGTTGIQNIERTIDDNQYYTLDGRRVAEPTKGLYILNGKKVVVK